MLASTQRVGRFRQERSPCIRPRASLHRSASSLTRSQPCASTTRRIVHSRHQSAMIAIATHFIRTGDLAPGSNLEAWGKDRRHAEYSTKYIRAIGHSPAYISRGQSVPLLRVCRPIKLSRQWHSSPWLALLTSHQGVCRKAGVAVPHSEFGVKDKQAAIDPQHYARP